MKYFEKLVNDSFIVCLKKYALSSDFQYGFISPHSNGGVPDCYFIRFQLHVTDIPDDVICNLGN